ncbi:MAG: hypothetical protein AABW56_01025 [Nanoarchaeota archaeon]
MPAYIEKFISELNIKDSKVAVSGLIINKDENLIFIDDKTGAIAISIQTDLPINTFVRVLGYLMTQNKEFQIQGHVIQNLNKVNKKLYNKIKLSMNQKQ